MFKNLKQQLTLAIFTIITFAIASPFSAFAVGNLFSLSPMYQMITLTPGETYYGNFNIVNPGTSSVEFYYNLAVRPFTTANDGDITDTENGDYTLMADWIELDKTEGWIAPNESNEVRFAIHVPEDAPAGGQYATIMVTSDQYRIENSSVDLREQYRAGHLIYADVAGETVRKGSMTDVNVPGFLFSGNITGSAAVTNEGNVHSQATHTMQIFPLFSGEEVFTNEEDPKKTWIMPGNTTVSSVSWDDTPSVGIFHVIYNVAYEGVESKVDKYVIVCPLWLLFLIIFALALLAFCILSTKKKSNK